MRNIVMVTYDSLRADHCGYGGYERDTTPNLDTLAEDGMAFTNAIAPASRTNPSLAGVFTGEQMIVRDRVSNNEYARYHLDRHGTIAEDLSNEGYTTGAFCPNAYSSRYYGFNRGFDHFEDFLFSNNQYQEIFQNHLSDSTLHTLVRNFRNYLRREEAFKTWDRYIDSVEEWVRNQSEPFLLWVFALDTHFPHLTPRNHRKWSSLFKQYYYNWRCNQLIDDLDPDMSEREIKNIIDIYDDSIRFGDVLIYELRERLGEFDPVYIIFGDHGEGFGERGIYGHFYPSLYEENIHVPLVISGEGIPDRQIKHPVSLTDLPEIVDRVVHNKDPIKPERKPVVSTDFDGRTDRNLTAVRVDNKKILRTRDDSACDEVYDLDDDPGEQENLSGENEQQSVMDILQEAVDRRELHESEMLKIKSSTENLSNI